MIVGVCMNIRISRFGCKADPVRLKELRANGKLVDSYRVETGLILPDPARIPGLIVAVAKAP